MNPTKKNVLKKGSHLVILLFLEEAYKLLRKFFNFFSSSHLVDAAVFLGGDDGFAQHGVQRELRHSPPQLRQFPSVVQGSQRVQLREASVRK